MIELLRVIITAACDGELELLASFKYESFRSVSLPTLGWLERAAGFSSSTGDDAD